MNFDKLIYLYIFTFIRPLPFIRITLHIRLCTHLYTVSKFKKHIRQNDLEFTNFTDLLRNLFFFTYSVSLKYHFDCMRLLHSFFSYTQYIAQNIKQIVSYVSMAITIAEIKKVNAILLQLFKADLILLAYTPTPDLTQYHLE